MKQFNQFEIKPPTPVFVGDKIKIVKILGKKIIVIQQIPPDGFPFETIIVQDNERYIFT